MSSKIFATKYQKAGKWRLVLCVGVIWTPCDFYIIIWRCDRNGLNHFFVKAAGANSHVCNLLFLMNFWSKNVF